jgi:hypothetical protein
LLAAATGVLLSLVAGATGLTVFVDKVEEGEVTLSPDSGPPGTVATFRGKRFGKFAVIKAQRPLYDGGDTIALGQADAQGRFTISGRIPTTVARGALDIVVTGESDGGTEFEAVTFYVTRR